VDGLPEIERFAAARNAIRDVTRSDDVERAPVRWTAVQLCRIVNCIHALPLQDHREPTSMVAQGN
jgi:hypothetical protein